MPEVSDDGGRNTINFLYIKVPFTRVRISVATILTVCAMLYADFSVYTLIVIASALLHELGHIILMYIYNVKIYSVTVLPFGAVIRSDASALPYKHESLVALAGPGVNIVCAVLTGVVCAFVPNKELVFFAVCNILLGLVNLVPVKTLDGGRAVCCLLCCVMPPEKADKYIELVSYLSLIFLAVASLVLLALTEYNFSLIIFCVYIFICTYVQKT